MATNLETINAIGACEARLERLVERSVPSIVEMVDAALTGKELTKAITEAIHVWACGDGDRPAQKTGPKGDQKVTNYGRGVNTLFVAVKRALVSPAPTDWLKLVRQSAENAHNKGAFSNEDILLAVKAALESESE